MSKYQIPSSWKSNTVLRAVRHQRRHSQKSLLFWVTNAERRASDHSAQGLASNIFTNISAKIIQFAFKLLAIAICLKKLLGRDSKQGDEIKCEKHRFPCCNSLFFAQIPRHLGFITCHAIYDFATFQKFQKNIAVNLRARVTQMLIPSFHFLGNNRSNAPGQKIFKKFYLLI